MQPEPLRRWMVYRWFLKQCEKLMVHPDALPFTFEEVYDPALDYHENLRKFDEAFRRAYPRGTRDVFEKDHAVAHEIEWLHAKLAHMEKTYERWVKEKVDGMARPKLREFIEETKERAEEAKQVLGIPEKEKEILRESFRAALVTELKARGVPSETIDRFLVAEMGKFEDWLKIAQDRYKKKPIELAMAYARRGLERYVKERARALAPKAPKAPEVPVPPEGVVIYDLRKFLAGYIPTEISWSIYRCGACGHEFQAQTGLETVMCPKCKRWEARIVKTWKEPLPWRPPGYPWY